MVPVIVYSTSANYRYDYQRIRRLSGNNVVLILQNFQKFGPFVKQSAKCTHVYWAYIVLLNLTFYYEFPVNYPSCEIVDHQAVAVVAGFN